MSNSPPRRDLKTTVADFTSMYWVWLRSQSRQSSRRGVDCGLRLGRVEFILGEKRTSTPRRKHTQHFACVTWDSYLAPRQRLVYPPVGVPKSPGGGEFYSV